MVLSTSLPYEKVNKKKEGILDCTLCLSKVKLSLFFVELILPFHSTFNHKKQVYQKLQKKHLPKKLELLAPS